VPLNHQRYPSSSHFYWLFLIIFDQDMIYGLVQWVSENVKPFMTIWNRKDIVKLHIDIHEDTLSLVKGMSDGDQKLKAIFTSFRSALEEFHRNGSSAKLHKDDNLSGDDVPSDLDLLCRLFFHVVDHQSFDPSYLVNMTPQNWPRNVESVIETFVDIYHMSPYLYFTLNAFSGPAKARQDLFNLCHHLQSSEQKADLYFLDFLRITPEQDRLGPDDAPLVRRKKPKDDSTTKTDVKGDRQVAKPRVQRPKTNTDWDEAEDLLARFGQSFSRVMEYTYTRIKDKKKDRSTTIQCYRAMDHLQMGWKDKALVRTSLSLFLIIIFFTHSSNF
jgi:hypothetical protein